MRRGALTDVGDYIRRVASLVDGLREAFSTVFEASSLLEQQRQGTITRRLAASPAILAVPTAIAGIYGMNFDYMPELRWRHGYFLVVSVIAVVAPSYTRVQAPWMAVGTSWRSPSSPQRPADID